MMISWIPDEPAAGYVAGDGEISWGDKEARGESITVVPCVSSVSEVSNDKERWLLFAGVEGNEGGGWRDFVGTFESLEKVEARYSRSRYAWGQAVRFTGPTTADCLWADEWRTFVDSP